MSEESAPVSTTRLPDLGPRGEGWVALQFVLLGLVALSGLLGGGAWGGALAALTALIGLALMLGGAVLLGRGLLDLGSNLTPLPRPRAGASLVETGAYRFVRHPIYGGLLVISVGWALVSASPLTLVLTLGLAAFFDLKSRREEAWLREQYSGYPDYVTRTRRLVPWIY